MPHHDIVIVGSGSGNSLFTPELEDRDIALVEENTRWFGGTCLNVGCIPTKMFVYPAELAADVAEAGRLGLSGGPLRADWKSIRDRVFGRIDPISDGGRSYRRDRTPNGTLYEAHAEFTGPRTLTLSTGETLTADQIVLAAGSRAVVPDLIADCGVPFHTSDTIMRIDELPESMVILGGGYIACEFAAVFAAFGVHVTVSARSRLLSDHDETISERLTEQVRERWNLHTGVVPAEITGEPGEVHIVLDDGRAIDAEMLLVAIGRQPNGDRLNLAAGGVDVDDGGRVVVDEHQRTSADGVWALGDISSPYQLKHVANHEERVVAHNLAHPDQMIAADHRFVPSAVFTHPQIASVGISEQDARESGRPFVVGQRDYSGTAYGWAMEDTVGFVKVLADPTTKQLIGAHIMGEHAPTLIQPLIQAMSFGLPAPEMARGQYWIHPALPEVVENAVLDLDL